MPNKHGTHNDDFLTKYIGPLVIKAFPDEEPERFEAASPLENVSKATMPSGRRADTYIRSRPGRTTASRRPKPSRMRSWKPFVPRSR